MIKAVLFDLDNTLIDFVRQKTICCKESVKAMIKAGLKADEKEAYTELMALYKPSSYEDPHIFQHYLKKVTGVISQKILSAGIVAYRKIVNELLTPYTGVNETLTKLKARGLKIGVLTDAPRLKAWIRLTTAGLADYFDTVITLGESKKKKPSITPFKKAITELDLKPDEILFVGDNPIRDIRGAKKSGMKTAYAKYGSFIEGDEKPDYVLDDIKDLLNII